MNIPIYRAKKIDADEWVEGYYVYSDIDRPTHLIRVDETFWEDSGLIYREVEIDSSTLAIHFPNMLDKNGKKIFASLSEDGVGGDAVIWKETVYVNFVTGERRHNNRDGIVILSKDSIRIDCRELETLEIVKSDCEVIRIHKGELA